MLTRDARPGLAPVALYALALSIRLVFAASLPFPGLDDPAFHLIVARNLAEGRGLTIDAIWSYLVPFPTITHPSNEFWMPLPSLVMAPFFVMFGPQLWVAQTVGAMVGALLAPIAWTATRMAFAPLGSWHLLGLLSGVLVAVNPLLAYQAVSTDSSVYFAVFGAGALLLGVAGRGKHALAAGVLSGLAYLARSEGVLIAISLAAYLGLGRRSKRDTLLLVAGAALIAVPWLARNWLVFGSPVPVPAATLALLPDYSAVFHFGSALPVDPGAQFALRTDALVNNLGVLLVQALFPIAPLAVAGYVSARRSPLVLTGCGGFVALFLGTALLFPVPTVHGTFYHSVGVFLPLLTVLSAQGLQRLGRNVGERLFGDPAFTGLLLSGAAVVLALVQLNLAMTAAGEVHGHWGEQFNNAASWLKEHSTGPVMTNEPHTLLYASDIPTLMIPWSDPPDTAREVARRYGARYLAGFGRFGAYPDVLEGAPGFTKVFEDQSVWVYEIRP